MNPFFERCTDLFFTGFDPPRTLVPATALSPATTTEKLKAFTPAPKPSPTPDASARNTATSETPMATPIDTPAQGQPQNPNSQASDSKQKLSDPAVEPNDSKPLEKPSAQPAPDLGKAPNQGESPNPQETSSPQQEGADPYAASGDTKGPNPPFTPPLNTPVGVVDDSHNINPAMPNTLPPANNSDSTAGGPAESPDRAKLNDPQQIDNAADNVGDLKKGSPSKFNPSVKSTEEPEEEIDPPGDATGDPRKEIPGNLGPFAGAVDDLNEETVPLGGTMGDLGKESSSHIDPLFEGTSNPGREDPSRFSPLVETTGDRSTDNPSTLSPDYATMDDPSDFNPLLKVSGERDPDEVDPLSENMRDPGREYSGKMGPGTPDDSGIVSSKKLDPSLETIGDPKDSNDPSQPNDPLYQFDLFHMSPKQILRIEGALALSAQRAPLPPKSAQDQEGASNQDGSHGSHGSPSMLRVLDHGTQTQDFSAPLSSPARGIQHPSVDGYAIKATPTVASGTSLTNLPPVSNGMSIGGTLESPSVTVGSSKIISALDPSGTGSLDGGSMSQESGPEGSNPSSPTRNHASTDKVDRSIGIHVQVFDSTAWITLALMVFI